MTRAITSSERRVVVGDPRQFGKVAVLLGGDSAEREISLMSGAAVHKALRARGIDAHRVDAADALVATLQAGRYDTITVPADYRAHQVPEGRTGRRGRRGGSPSEFMAEVDRLLRDGLWRPSQRNDATLKLCWYMRVIWGWDAERTEDGLWIWIQQSHNGQSREYNTSPDKVRRKIAGAVRAFKPEKVGTGHRATESPTEPRSGLGGAIGQYVDAQPLDERERVFLAALLEYAHRRGTNTLDGQLEVQVPSRTAKGFNRQYGPLMRLLTSQGIVELAGRYGAQIGRCNTYRMPCLDRCTK